MAVMPRWDYLPGDAAAAASLGAALGLDPTVARLLCQRGLDTPAKSKDPRSYSDFHFGVVDS
jgi:hypothetical protein